jgi:hypothetical protein
MRHRGLPDLLEPGYQTGRLKHNTHSFSFSFSFKNGAWKADRTCVWMRPGTAGS